MIYFLMDDEGVLVGEYDTKEKAEKAYKREEGTCDLCQIIKPAKKTKKELIVDWNAGVIKADDKEFSIGSMTEESLFKTFSNYDIFYVGHPPIEGECLDELLTADEQMQDA